MNKEFIPYEQALALKELGFDKMCFAVYDHNKELVTARQRHFTDVYVNMSNSKAPTFSQAFRWFREKYDLQGYIYSTTVRGNDTKGKHFSDYCWHINGIDKPFLSTDRRDMDGVTYEEAEQACLEKLIQLVLKLK